MTLLKRKVKKEIEEEIIIGAKCDFCAQPIPNECLEMEGYGKLTIIFGYPSRHDMEIWQGEVCDNCASIKFKNRLRRREMRIT